MMPLRRDLRSVWLSDVHLGTRDCRADLLLDFLRNDQMPEGPTTLRLSIPIVPPISAPAATSVG